MYRSGAVLCKVGYQLLGMLSKIDGEHIRESAGKQTQLPDKCERPRQLLTLDWLMTELGHYCSCSTAEPHSALLHI